jgi:hypothetical protein
MNPFGAVADGKGDRLRNTVYSLLDVEMLDPTITAHEEAFVHAFVDKDRRERLLFELRKHRGRFLGRFSHDALKFLDPRFVTPIKPPNSDPVTISRLLHANGAENTCYAMSHNEKIDGQILPLADAVAAAVGFGMPTILSCCPGLLAYIETEQVRGPPDRFIVSRRGMMKR